jgi:hypothetical protein
MHASYLVNFENFCPEGMVQSWIGVINLLAVMKIQNSSFQLEILDQQLLKLKKLKKSAIAVS